MIVAVEKWITLWCRYPFLVAVQYHEAPCNLLFIVWITLWIIPELSTGVWITFQNVGNFFSSVENSL